MEMEGLAQELKNRVFTLDLNQGVSYGGGVRTHRLLLPPARRRAVPEALAVFSQSCPVPIRPPGSLPGLSWRFACRPLIPSVHPSKHIHPPYLSTHISNGANVLEAQRARTTVLCLGDHTA